MMQETRFLKPLCETTINELFSPQDAYAFVHSSAFDASLSIDAVFALQIMRNNIKAKKGGVKKGYAQCIIKKRAAYRNLRNERKISGYPLGQYEDIIFFLKASIEGTCDFLRKDETNNFYTEHLGAAGKKGTENVLRVRIKWCQEYSRWNIAAAAVSLDTIQLADTIVVVPYEGHYSSSDSTGGQGVHWPKNTRFL